MLTRLFNQTLPSPTEEQVQTMLENRDIGISSEIISVAYEPRFKLYALGTATGGFHIINENNYWYSYTPLTAEPPILKIIPLTNSPTFLSACSYSLYNNHCFKVPREERPSQINDIFYKPKSILSEVEPDKNKSTITHWVVTHEGQIFHHSVSLKYDIIDYAVSPIHPEFALLLTKTGSLYGFSVEEMKFTDLYIDFFEGKNVHSIICPFDMKFFICHDTIEKLDMSDKEVTKVAPINVDQIDVQNEKSGMIAAIENSNKKPSLFKGNRQFNSIEIDDGSFATCATLVNDREWAAVVHSGGGDSIYFCGDMKIRLEGEMLIPAIVVEYQKPLSRELPQSVNFFTSTGRFFNLSGNSVDHFMLKPIEPKFAFIDRNDNVYVFNTKQRCFVFERMNYAGSFMFNWGKPLAVLNGYALCENENKELFVAEIKTNQEVKLDSPLTPAPIVSTQIFEGYIDFLCENDKVIRIDLATNDIFVPTEIVDDQELSVYANWPKNDQDIICWRPFSGTFACLKKVNGKTVLTVGEYTSSEVCEKNEEVVFFDVIDESGKVTPKSATFVLIATTFHLGVFALDKKGIKRIRHVSLGRDRLIEASVTSWGVLIARTRHTVAVFALPDVSHKPVARLGLDYDAPPPLSSSADLQNDAEQEGEAEVEAEADDKANNEVETAETATTADVTSEDAKEKGKKHKHKFKLKLKHHKSKDKDKKKSKDKSKGKDKDKSKDKDKEDGKDDEDEAADDVEEDDGDADDAENLPVEAESSTLNESEVAASAATSSSIPLTDDDAPERLLAVNPIVLPHKGLAVFERNLASLYLRDVSLPPCFDKENAPPVLVPPPATGLLKRLFGKKTDVTIEEANRYFLFTRSDAKAKGAAQQQQQQGEQGEKGAAAAAAGSGPADEDPAARAASIGSSLAETQQVMQELLVKASERGEQLNELEIKAQRLLNSARQYKNNARKFRH